jgi:hypothetical protein
MQSIGLIRIDFEDLPVNLLGSVKFARLMVLDGRGEGFGEAGHWSRIARPPHWRDFVRFLVPRTFRCPQFSSGGAT